MRYLYDHAGMPIGTNLAFFEGDVLFNSCLVNSCLADLFFLAS